jgi:hypothetical protein
LLSAGTCEHILKADISQQKRPREPEGGTAAARDEAADTGMIVVSVVWFLCLSMVKADTGMLFVSVSMVQA